MRAQPRRRAEELVGKGQAGQEPAFLRKTFEMICACDADETDLACWTANGETFVVKNPDMFSSVVIPRFFKREFPLSLSLSLSLRLSWKRRPAAGSVIVHFSHTPFAWPYACSRRTVRCSVSPASPTLASDHRGGRDGRWEGAAHALLHVLPCVWMVVAKLHAHGLHALSVHMGYTFGPAAVLRKILPAGICPPPPPALRF